MYIARINGGLVGNEFSAAANNKRKERKRKKRGAEPVHFAMATENPE